MFIFKAQMYGGYMSMPPPPPPDAAQALAPGSPAMTAPPPALPAPLKTFQPPLPPPEVRGGHLFLFIAREAFFLD